MIQYGEDGGIAELDPLSAFSPEDCKRWNLDIKAERITRMWDGKKLHYESWRELIVDACASHWYAWRGVLQNPVERDRRLTATTIMKTISRMNMDGGQISVVSSILLSFLGRCTDETQRRNRKRIAGECLNGFKLWRRLHWDHPNCVEACDLGGVLHFMTFPRCDSFEGLQAHVDEWTLLKDEVAKGTPDKSLLPAC